MSHGNKICETKIRRSGRLLCLARALSSSGRCGSKEASLNLVFGEARDKAVLQYIQHSLHRTLSSDNGNNNNR